MCNDSGRLVPKLKSRIYEPRRSEEVGTLREDIDARAEAALTSVT